MQGDGNLVMYKNNGTQPNDAVWSSGTNNQTCPDECSYTFRMQNECDKKSSISLFINKSSKYNGRGEDIWKMYGN
ncbi:MAG: hypothetical protein IPN49_16645 [Saprospiraceae bacterium]|nr:hypothetical protein [Saprospiraceae bacterium]